ncbi:MAG: YdcF family protein [Chitinophagales bacterium]|nr:YdcF family protein [Chitinophagales bacterium]
MKFLKRFLLLLFIAGFTALAITWWLKSSTRQLYVLNVSEAPYDAVIIPGLPFDTPVPNNLFKARILWSKSLFNKGLVKNIIYSGSAVHTPYVEGEIMKAIALQMGLPSANIYAEVNAQHTTENIDYSLQLARTLRFQKIAVASDPFQTIFLKRHIAKHQLEVALLPFDLDSFPAFKKYSFPLIDYRKFSVQNFVPLKERNN